MAPNPKFKFNAARPNDKDPKGYDLIPIETDDKLLQVEPSTWYKLTGYRMMFYTKGESATYNHFVLPDELIHAHGKAKTLQEWNRTKEHGIFWNINEGEKPVPFLQDNWKDEKDEDPANKAVCEKCGNDRFRLYNDSGYIEDTSFYCTSCGSDSWKRVKE